MKAFEIVWSGLPQAKGIYAAPTASKAKYHVAKVVVEVGYARKVGDVFSGLSCKRKPEHDQWAEQLNRVLGVSSEYFED
jgi:hypothetical protein